MTYDSRILIITPCFFPAVSFGGPIFSLLGIAKRLNVLCGCPIDVVSPRYADPFTVEDLPVNIGWSNKTSYRVYWINTNLVRQIFDLCVFLIKSKSDYSLYYVNGTFDVSSLLGVALGRLLNKKVVFSPRGAIQALAEGAGNRRNIFLKKLILRIYSLLLKKTDVVMASSSHEEVITQRFIPNCVYETVANIVPMPMALSNYKRKLSGDYIITMMGRVHKKKGIDLVIGALRDLPDNFILKIYGYGSDRYIQSLVNRVEELKLASRVTFNAFVDGENKERALMESDVLVLPSESENFGNVVLEALARGTPVIVSRYMPFQDVTSLGVGRVVDRNSNAIAEAISALASLPRGPLRRRCERYYDSFYGSDFDAKLQRIFKH